MTEIRLLGEVRELRVAVEETPELARFEDFLVRRGGMPQTEARGLVTALVASVLEGAGGRGGRGMRVHLEAVVDLRATLQARYGEVIRLFRTRAPRVTELPPHLQPEAFRGLFNDLADHLNALRSPVERSIDALDLDAVRADWREVEAQQAQEALTGPSTDPDLELTDEDIEALLGTGQVPPGAESPAVTGYRGRRRIDDVRVREGRVVGGEVQRPGPARLDIQDLERLPFETQRQAATRVRRIVGRVIGSGDQGMQPLEDAWNAARARVLDGRTISDLTREEMLRSGGIYDQVRDEFWAEVRRRGATGLLESSGFDLSQGGAPLLRTTRPGGAPVQEVRLSLDHVDEKAIGDNWQIAIDAGNLRFELQNANSLRDSLQRALRIGAYTEP